MNHRDGLLKLQAQLRAKVQERRSCFPMRGEHIDDEKVAAVVLKHGRYGVSAIITPGLPQDGRRWRVSFFEDHGIPVGHTVGDSLERLVNDCWGYEIVNVQRKNPADARTMLRDFAEIGEIEPGYDFEYFYPYGEDDYADESPDDLRHGRRVHWVGTDGKIVKIDPVMTLPIAGNVFDADKLRAVAEAVAHGTANSDDGKPYLTMGYGTVQIVTKDDVRESKERFCLGSERGPGDFDEWQERPLDNNDVGRLLYTVRDGNHRTFGAMLGGENNVWMLLSANQLQDVEEWRRGRRVSPMHDRLMEILDEKLRSD